MWSRHRKLSRRCIWNWIPGLHCRLRTTQLHVAPVYPCGNINESFPVESEGDLDLIYSVMELRTVQTKQGLSISWS